MFFSEARRIDIKFSNLNVFSANMVRLRKQRLLVTYKAQILLTVKRTHQSPLNLFTRNIYRTKVETVSKFVRKNAYGFGQLFVVLQLPNGKVVANCCCLWKSFVIFSFVFFWLQSISIFTGQCQVLTAYWLEDSEQGKRGALQTFALTRSATAVR